MHRLWIMVLMLVALGLGARQSAALQGIPQIPGEMAFTGVDQNHRYQIFMMNADGSGVRQFTHTDYGAFLPVWSPDGGKLLYSEYLAAGSSGTNPPLKWMVVNADGTGAVELARDPADGFLLNPLLYFDWSSDGSYIIYNTLSGRIGSHMNQYVIEPDGSNRMLVAQYIPPDLGRAQFTADDQLFFNRNKGLFHATRIGTDVRLITSLVKAVPSVLSPDGSEIVTVTDSNLMLLDADGENMRTILAPMTGRTGDERVTFVNNMRWSPDVEYISGSIQVADAAASTGEATPEGGTAPQSANVLFTVRKDGTGYTVIDSNDVMLTWSPDSQFIAYSVTDARGDTQITVARPDNSGAVMISTEGTHSQPAWRPNPELADTP